MPAVEFFDPSVEFPLEVSVLGFRRIFRNRFRSKRAADVSEWNCFIPSRQTSATQRASCARGHCCINLLRAQLSFLW
jgi:hypothetical protein